ncbi:hypothetical protein ACHAWF_013056 [Thalassiosira exigua]
MVLEAIDIDGNGGRGNGDANLSPMSVMTEAKTPKLITQSTPEPTLLEDVIAESRDAADDTPSESEGRSPSDSIRANISDIVGTSDLEAQKENVTDVVIDPCSSIQGYAKELTDGSTAEVNEDDTAAIGATPSVSVGEYATESVGTDKKLDPSDGAAVTTSSSLREYARMMEGETSVLEKSSSNDYTNMYTNELHKSTSGSGNATERRDAPSDTPIEQQQPEGVSSFVDALGLNASQSFQSIVDNLSKGMDDLSAASGRVSKATETAVRDTEAAVIRLILGGEEEANKDGEAPKPTTVAAEETSVCSKKSQTKVASPPSSPRVTVISVSTSDLGEVDAGDKVAPRDEANISPVLEESNEDADKQQEETSAVANENIEVKAAEQEETSAVANENIEAETTEDEESPAVKSPVETTAQGDAEDAISDAAPKVPEATPSKKTKFSLKRLYKSPKKSSRSASGPAPESKSGEESNNSPAPEGTTKPTEDQTDKQQGEESAAASDVANKASEATHPPTTPKRKRFGLKKLYKTPKESEPVPKPAKEPKDGPVMEESTKLPKEAMQQGDDATAVANESTEAIPEATAKASEIVPPVSPKKKRFGLKKLFNKTAKEPTNPHLESGPESAPKHEEDSPVKEKSTDPVEEDSVKPIEEDDNKQQEEKAESTEECTNQDKLTEEDTVKLQGEETGSAGEDDTNKESAEEVAEKQQEAAAADEEHTPSAVETLTAEGQQEEAKEEREMLKSALSEATAKASEVSSTCSEKKKFGLKKPSYKAPKMPTSPRSGSGSESASKLSMFSRPSFKKSKK